MKKRVSRMTIDDALDIAQAEIRAIAGDLQPILADHSFFISAAALVLTLSAGLKTAQYSEALEEHSFAVLDEIAIAMTALGARTIFDGGIQ